MQSSTSGHSGHIKVRVSSCFSQNMLQQQRARAPFDDTEYPLDDELKAAAKFMATGPSSDIMVKPFFPSADRGREKHAVMPSEEDSTAVFVSRTSLSRYAIMSCNTYKS